MAEFKGKGVYGAIAIGKVRLFTRKDSRVRRVHSDDTAGELARVAAAKKKALSQLQAIYEKALTEVGEASAAIFDIHMVMIEDEDYNDSIKNIIETQSVNAEYAIAVTAENFAQMFSSIDDEYMQARAADVKDISNRLIACMGSGSEEEKPSGEKMVICADDLSPSETVSLDKDCVLAFVTAGGSSNSHTAILARNMNIPAVVCVGEEFLGAIADGMEIIVDGSAGEVFTEPDAGLIAKYEKKLEDEKKKKALLSGLIGRENVTLNGRKIDIFANIGGVDGVGPALENDAGGIGLFRSEFLYLEASDYPTEEEQLAVYRKVLEGMGGRKVIIRTLDIGADKQVGYFGLDSEENPALGLRAIRICLTRPEIFKTQLRALYRASVYGSLGIMFPMIISEKEVQEILAACEAVKAELKAENLPFSDKVELGIMIETPAAALISDRLAPLVDFFSVGTNDLTQYTLAIDRRNAKLEDFCDTHHEAVLRLIKMAADNAHANGKWIGICGELAADTSLTAEFLRMGIDELSVSPSCVLPLRDAVRKTDLGK